MLEAAGLGVSYGTTRAVDGFDLRVEAGEAVALLGANGAGKTSTLRALSRLIPSDGRISFDGSSIERRPPEELPRLGLVHVPEGRHVFPNLTVDENILVGATGRGNRRQIFTKDAVYDLFPPLRALQKRYGWALSGGEQQMLVIGRALMSSPRLLMLDEPSLGLAPIVTKAVYRSLAEVKSEISLLIVEQNASIALEICDRGYVLMSGRCVLSDRTDHLSDRQALLESYLGHADVADEPLSGSNGPGHDSGGEEATRTGSSH